MPKNKIYDPNRFYGNTSFGKIYDFVKNYTMLSQERCYNIYNCTSYICRNNMIGDIVEFGTYAGGSLMIALLTLIKYKKLRNIYIFDTFGIEPPSSDIDITYKGKSAKEFEVKDKRPTLEEVKKNLLSTGYPEQLITFVKGDICNTLKDFKFTPLVLAHLDVDWYEVTKICLEKVYDSIIPKGCLIIDDYGCWKGCKQATDEFFKERKLYPLLGRVDYTGIVITK